MPEIGCKLAYNEKWDNGPGMEAVKALLDGVLKSKIAADVNLNWYVHVCVYLLVACKL